MSLRLAHMSEGMFSHVEAQISPERRFVDQFGLRCSSAHQLSTLDHLVIL